MQAYTYKIMTYVQEQYFKYSTTKGDQASNHVPRGRLLQPTKLKVSNIFLRRAYDIQKRPILNNNENKELYIINKDNGVEKECY